MVSTIETTVQSTAHHEGSVAELSIEAIEVGIIIYFPGLQVEALEFVLGMFAFCGLFK